MLLCQYNKDEKERVKRMKRAKCILCLMLTLCSMLAFVSLAFAANTSGNPKEGVLVAYVLGEEMFESFVKKPEMSILTSKNIMILSYTKSDKEGHIDCIREMNGEITPYTEVASGYMRLGTLPVYTEFIDFVGSTKAISAFLRKNGITSEITEHAVVEFRYPSSVNIPITLWVQTTGANYLITVEGDIDNPHSTDFIYTIYTNEEYFDKYGLKDGVLKVNDEDITKGNYVKFKNTGAYIPLRAVMESLGAKVDWDAERGVVLLICKGTNYVLDPRKPSLVTDLVSYDLLMPPPGSSYFSQIVNDRVIMDNYTMQEVVKLMGATIELDFERLIVNVNQ